MYALKVSFSLNTHVGIKSEYSRNKTLKITKQSSGMGIKVEVTSDKEIVCSFDTLKTLHGVISFCVIVEDERTYIDIDKVPKELVQLIHDPRLFDRLKYRNIVFVKRVEDLSLSKEKLERDIHY